MSPGLNELRDLSYKEIPYMQILLTPTEGNLIESIMDISIWNLNAIVNQSHISFKGFIVNKSWQLFRMSWFFSKINCPVSGHGLCTSLVNPLQCPTPRAPALRAIFAPLQLGKRKSTSVNLSNLIPLHSNQALPIPLSQPDACPQHSERPVCACCTANNPG